MSTPPQWRHATTSHRLSILILLAGSIAVVPPPAEAIAPSADREILWTQRCVGAERTTVPSRACVYGARRSRRVVALVGDSHTAHLFPAVERIARAHRSKLIVMVKVSCPTWPCPTMVGGITKYRDEHHLTATYARTALGAPGQRLDRALTYKAAGLPSAQGRGSTLARGVGQTVRPNDVAGLGATVPTHPVRRGQGGR